MPLGPVIAAAVVVGVSATGAVALAGGETFSTWATVITVTSLLPLSLAAATGLLLARGRWSRWAAIGVPVAWGAVAAAAEAGTIWLVAALTAAVIVAVAAGPAATGWLRRRPSSSGPPPQAVVLLLGLVGFPLVMVMVDGADLSPLAGAAALCSLLAAAIYSRGGVGGIITLRLLTPAAVILAAVAVGWPGLLAPLVAGAGLLWLAWSRSARDAAVPVLPAQGTGYRIPPELAPPEVLDAAGLDEQGRRK